MKVGDLVRLNEPVRQILVGRLTDAARFRTGLIIKVQYQEAHVLWAGDTEIDFEYLDGLEVISAAGA